MQLLERKPQAGCGADAAITTVKDGSFPCPGCGVEVPVTEAGTIWCWQCGVQCWVHAETAEVALVQAAVDGAGSMPDDMAADEEQQECFDLSEDPDGGLHGECPWCEARLMTYLPGRNRCEVCDREFMVYRRRGDRRYQWIADDELFSRYGGPVRWAYRDD